MTSLLIVAFVFQTILIFFQVILLLRTAEGMEEDTFTARIVTAVVFPMMKPTRFKNFLIFSGFNILFARSMVEVLLLAIKEPSAVLWWIDFICVFGFFELLLVLVFARNKTEVIVRQGAAYTLAGAILITWVVSIPTLVHNYNYNQTTADKSLAEVKQLTENLGY